MIPVLLAAPAAEATRRPTGDPPGDPPGDFGPVLAQAAEAAPAQPKGRADGARTATAEGASTEAADGGSGQTDTSATDDGGAPATAGPVLETAAPAASATTPLTEGAPAAPAETPAAVPAPAPELAPQQPPIDASVDYKDPAAHQDGTAVVKAPPGEVASQPVRLPTKADMSQAGSVTPVATETDAQTATAKQASQTEAAAAIAAQAAAEPAQAAAPSDTPVAAATPTPGGAQPKTHTQSSDGRQQQSQTPELPTTKAATKKIAETAAPAAADQSPAQAKTSVLKTEAPASTPVDTTTQPQPVSTTAPQQSISTDRTAATETPVRAHSSLAQLAENARAVIRMAAREGAAQAHITLHPAELGEVTIRLRYHAGGVSADVLAESHAAAQALQGAASELKRSLEAQGVVVHGLDVRTSEHEKQHRAHEQHQQGHRAHRHAHAFDFPDQTTIDTSSLPLPIGAVDVLA